LVRDDQVASVAAVAPNRTILRPASMLSDAPAAHGRLSVSGRPTICWQAYRNTPTSASAKAVSIMNRLRLPITAGLPAAGPERLLWRSYFRNPSGRFWLPAVLRQAAIAPQHRLAEACGARDRTPGRSPELRPRGNERWENRALFIRAGRTADRAEIRNSTKSEFQPGGRSPERWTSGIAGPGLVSDLRCILSGEFSGEYRLDRP